MATKAKYETMCTVCDRSVGVTESWVRWQSGQSPEWRVTRHATRDRVNRNERRKICTGSGVMVPPLAVTPADG